MDEHARLEQALVGGSPWVWRACARGGGREAQRRIKMYRELVCWTFNLDGAARVRKGGELRCGASRRPLR